ncbi:MAG: hypothetical protein OEU99_06830, partial [Nitrospira sp.]|nr:hypothetical protein [Nitrospira sp.]
SLCSGVRRCALSLASIPTEANDASLTADRSAESTIHAKEIAVPARLVARIPSPLVVERSEG